MHDVRFAYRLHHARRRAEGIQVSTEIQNLLRGNSQCLHLGVIDASMDRGNHTGAIGNELLHRAIRQ